MIQTMELSETDFLKTMFNMFREIEIRLRILPLARNVKKNQIRGKYLLNKKIMENLKLKTKKQKTVT